MHALFSYIVINVDPVLLHLGPLQVRWYGLMYAVGLALALWVALPDAERRGIPRDKIYSIFWGTTIAGLIGGRLYFVAQNDPLYFLAHPAQIVAVWEGGMAFYGAIFLGVPVLWLLSRHYGVRALALLDSVALFAPLAQAVGRIGNIINGDIIGYPSTLPWATAYANPHNTFVRPLCAPPYTGCTAYQPAGAYELISSAILFALLWRLRKRRWPAGLLFVLYVALYSLSQLIVFIWRDNEFVLGPLKQAQATALVVLVLLVPIALWLTRRGATPHSPSGTTLQDSHAEGQRPSAAPVGQPDSPSPGQGERLTATPAATQHRGILPPPASGLTLAHMSDGAEQGDRLETLETEERQGRRSGRGDRGRRAGGGVGGGGVRGGTAGRRAADGARDAAGERTGDAATGGAGGGVR